jgi:hypothetical protein
VWPPHASSGMRTVVTMTLLRQNRELKRLGIWNWSLPAFAGKLPDGRSYNACPSAGVCAQACYARSARNCIQRKGFTASVSATGVPRSRPRPSN